MVQPVRSHLQLIYDEPCLCHICIALMHPLRSQADNQQKEEMMRSILLELHSHADIG